jgi:hypothetical protein
VAARNTNGINYATHGRERNGLNHNHYGRNKAEGENINTTTTNGSRNIALKPNGQKGNGRPQRKTMGKQGIREVERRLLRIN